MRVRAVWQLRRERADLSPDRVMVTGWQRVCTLRAAMAMPEFWYDVPSDTRDMAARERALASHASMLGLAVLVFALLVAALLVAR